MADRGLIKTLTELWGPPGHEYRVRETIQGLVRDLADEIRVDATGNLICRMGSGGPKIMVSSHMDEIGLIVTHIDKDGFARFTSHGFLLPSTLFSARVKFANGALGVIGMEGAPWDPNRTPKLAEMFIDLSLAGDRREEVRVGDAGALWRECTEHGDRMIAKSMDDRIGCVVAIEAMRALKGQTLPNEVYFVFSTQEEIGLRGAQPAAFSLEPDLGIALDVTSTGDTPKADLLDVKLGGGAAIKVMDVGHIVPPAIKALFTQRAEEAGIKHQFEILTIGTTDAARIQTSRGGVPSGVISIPCRYVHTTSETVDLNDVDACVKLLTTIVTQPIVVGDLVR
jgi:endoglucanase